MCNTIINNRTKLGLPGFCVLFVAAAACQEANAQLSFKTALSSNEAVLAAPTDPTVLNIATWDSPLMRIIARSRPFIEVRNTSTVETLTSVNLSIGDTNYNFSDAFLGAFAVPGQTNPAGVGIASATTQNGGDLLTIDFANGGLAPQEFIRFQIDIDPEPSVPGLFIHPDYRTVLFDLFDNTDSDNGVFTASFDQGPDLSLTLPDIPNPTGPVFTNGVIRPYDVTEQIDFIDPPAVVIPEPGGVLLAMMAVSGVSALAMRRRLG